MGKASKFRRSWGRHSKHLREKLTKVWPQTSRSLHKPDSSWGHEGGRLRQLTSTSTMVACPGGPWPPTPLLVHRPGSWEVRHQAWILREIRTHSSRPRLLSWLMLTNQVTQHIQRSSNGSERGQPSEARAHTGRRKGAEWHVSAAGDVGGGGGSFEWIYLLPLGRDLSMKSSPPRSCSWMTSGSLINSKMGPSPSTIHFGRLEGRETAFQCFLPKDTKCKSPGKGTQVHWNTPSCKHPTNIKIIHSVLEPQKCVFPLSRWKYYKFSAAEWLLDKTKRAESIKYTSYAGTVRPLWRGCGPDCRKAWRWHWWRSQSSAVVCGSDLEDTAKTVLP